MMAKEKTGVAPELSLRQKSKEEPAIRKWRRQEQHQKEKGSRDIKGNK